MLVPPSPFLAPSHLYLHLTPLDPSRLFPAVFPCPLQTLLLPWLSPLTRMY